MESRVPDGDSCEICPRGIKPGDPMGTPRAHTGLSEKIVSHFSRRTTWKELQ